MPIYAYKCASCGFAKDVLQKISDEPLTDCPHCSAAAFSKQVTAAGFQLKGSGWYVTDFRGDKTASPAKKDETASPDAAAGASSEPANQAPAASGTTDSVATPASAPATKSVAAPAVSTATKS